MIRETQRALEVCANALLFALLFVCIAAVSQTGAEARLSSETSAGLDGDGGVSRGVAWGDIDNDGFPDLAVANTDSGNVFLYRNVGGARFARQRSSPVEIPRGNAQGVVFVDFDNDGWLDLYVTTEGAPNRLYRNDRSGNLQPIQMGTLTASTTASTQSCWADIDSDGWLDVFIVNADYQDDVLYRNIDGREFTPVTGPWIGKRNHGRSCAFGDPDGDGKPDLYVANAYVQVGEGTRYASNYFYRNIGGGQFEDVRAGEFVNAYGYSYGVSWFDYDQDGDEDLFVSNISRFEPNVLYENVDGRLFMPLWSSIVLRDIPGPVKGHVWADFDNDGDADLFVAEGHGGARPEHAPFDNVNRYYEFADGNFRVADAGDAVKGERISAGAAGADVDRDGDIDLFVANWAGEDLNNQFFRNEGGGNAIQLRLRGVQSNRMGVGAKVSIETGSGQSMRIQHRSLWLNMGYASMSEPIIHFGLGGETTVRNVVVHWPSGKVDRHSALAANALYELKEGSAQATRLR